MATRRAIIGLGAVALGYVALTKGGPALWARLGPLPEFSTEGMPAGFRKQVGAAELSAGLANPLIGIDDGAAPQPCSASAPFWGRMPLWRRANKRLMI